MKTWQTAAISLGALGAAGAVVWYVMKSKEKETPPEAGGTPPTGSPPPPPGSVATGYVSGKPSTFPVASVGNGQVMRSDAASAFLAMQSAAKSAGINLTATSGFRTNEQQQKLYDGYINKLPGYNMAAKPGYSNHQSGISVDIGGVGSFTSPAYAWLKANASRYGFVNDVRGEYWHWTFKGSSNMAVAGVSGNLGAVDLPSAGSGAAVALVVAGIAFWVLSSDDDDSNPERECEAAAKRWKKTCVLEKAKARSGKSSPSSSPATNP